MTEILLTQIGVVPALLVVLLMGVTATGWRRSTGLAFAVLVPVLMFGAFDYGWDVSYHTITETRAARIQGAVERFHARDGLYPQELGELIPRDLVWIPGPVILRGQGWCYQGGQDGYRLGAIYRDTFGTPLSLRIYASAGSVPESVWACEEKLVELKARHAPVLANGLQFFAGRLAGFRPRWGVAPLLGAGGRGR